MKSRRSLEQPFDDLATTWWSDSGVLRSLDVLLAPVRLPFLAGALRDSLGPGPLEVLDLGSGGGALAEALVGHGHSVAALDPSLPSLQAGSEHGEVAGVSGVSFVAGRGEGLPFASESFDAVVCMEVLEHVDDPAVVVAEAARMLRPGGVFIFSGPNRTLRSGLGLVFLAQTLLGVIPRGTHRWNRFIRPGEMDRHMRSAGLSPILTIGVGMQARALLPTLGAVLGLVSRRLSYPAAATRIHLVAGGGTGWAYQGFGRRV